MKNCLVCEELKPKSEFGACAKGREGLHPWCRQCVREYNRARRARPEPLQSLRGVEPAVGKRTRYAGGVEGISSAPAACGVYEILDVKTGCAYVGASMNVLKRLKEHQTRLRHGSHECRELQSRVISRGLAAVRFQIVQLCLPGELEDVEKSTQERRRLTSTLLNNSKDGWYTPGKLPRK